MPGIIGQIISGLSGGAGGALAQAVGAMADVQEMEDAAQEALQESLYTAEGLNLGQQELIDGYIFPEMENTISGDPEEFTAGDLIDAGYSSHYAAEQALSLTIQQAATAAARARDQVKRAAQLEAIAEGE